MLHRALISSALALSLVAGTTAEAAAPRTPAPVSPESEMASGDSTVWIVGGVLVALILLILILDDGDDEDDLPNSP